MLPFAFVIGTFRALLSLEAGIIPTVDELVHCVVDVGIGRHFRTDDGAAEEGRFGRREVYEPFWMEIETTTVFIHSFAMFCHFFLCESRGPAWAVSIKSSGHPPGEFPKSPSLKPCE